MMNVPRPTTPIDNLMAIDRVENTDTPATNEFLLCVTPRNRIRKTLQVDNLTPPMTPRPQRQILYLDFDVMKRAPKLPIIGSKSPTSTTTDGDYLGWVSKECSSKILVVPEKSSSSSTTSLVRRCSTKAARNSFSALCA
eukprot:CAMPEP_0194218806 /NCGR_PEP_ID=MMETSP0156-20130528/24558_1 /TAXON_ID=33649 /ORGANISM="Thalassionema nitzschioides, Strain L26-B" /LENGTH=138 /DNA_ID=CAMNT_0038948277 /DNA_START=35 /DNA_END=451 /DNA_ORIENTATION=+